MSSEKDKGQGLRSKVGDAVNASMLRTQTLRKNRCNQGGELWID